MVIGAGPNGLAAAIRLAQEGHSVLVVEAADTPGGGCRSAELTLPGFTHDVCSAIHPLGYGSPFFRTLGLERYGLEWIQPSAALAHPFDDGPPALLERSVEATAATLGRTARYQRLMGSLVPDWDTLSRALREPLRMARYPFGLARFGLKAILSSQALTEGAFPGAERAVLLGHGGPLHAAAGTVSECSLWARAGHAGHAVGWPFPCGGSQQITNALVAHLRSLGGEIVTGQEVKSLGELAFFAGDLCDITPRQLVQIAGDSCPVDTATPLSRYRYGMGAFKLDWALDGPIPWKSPEWRGRRRSIWAARERRSAPRSGRRRRAKSPTSRTFCSPSRASLTQRGRPRANTRSGPTATSPTARPGHDRPDRGADRALRAGLQGPHTRPHVIGPAAMHRYNANYFGGDINGGVQDWRQLFTRPVARWTPWSTPVPGLYLCSSSTPPGGGVHGMCGYYAAMDALTHLRQEALHTARRLRF